MENGDVPENANEHCQDVPTKRLVPLHLKGLTQLSNDGSQTDVTQWVMEYVKEKATELLNLIASTEMFDSSGGGALRMCAEMGIPFLGKVQLDPQLCNAAEEGRSRFADERCSVSSPALKSIIEKLLENQGISRMALDESG